jgi:hypothetical protein
MKCTMQRGGAVAFLPSDLNHCFVEGRQGCIMYWNIYNTSERIFVAFAAGHFYLHNF